LSSRTSLARRTGRSWAALSCAQHRERRSSSALQSIHQRAYDTYFALHTLISVHTHLLRSTYTQLVPTTSVFESMGRRPLVTIGPFVWRLRSHCQHLQRQSEIAPKTVRTQSERSEFAPNAPISFRNQSERRERQKPASRNTSEHQAWTQGHTEASRDAPAAIPARSPRSRFAPELVPNRSTPALSAGRGSGSQNRGLGRRFRFGVDQFRNVRACGLYRLCVHAGACGNALYRHHRPELCASRHALLKHHDRSRSSVSHMPLQSMLSAVTRSCVRLRAGLLGGQSFRRPSCAVLGTSMTRLTADPSFRSTTAASRSRCLLPSMGECWAGTRKRGLGSRRSVPFSQCCHIGRSPPTPLSRSRRCR